MEFDALIRPKFPAGGVSSFASSFPARGCRRVRREAQSVSLWPWFMFGDCPCAASESLEADVLAQLLLAEVGEAGVHRDAGHPGVDAAPPPPVVGVEPFDDFDHRFLGEFLGFLAAAEHAETRGEQAALGAGEQLAAGLATGGGFQAMGLCEGNETTLLGVAVGKRRVGRR